MTKTFRKNNREIRVDMAGVMEEFKQKGSRFYRKRSIKAHTISNPSQYILQLLQKGWQQIS